MIYDIDTIRHRDTGYVSRIASNLYYGYQLRDWNRINSARMELRELGVRREDIDELEDIYSRMNHFSKDSMRSVLLKYKL